MTDDAGALRTELAIQKAITADFRVENQALRDKLAALTGTCDASMVMNRGLTGTPTRFGPCILRHRHDGPGHKGANGAEWWPVTDPQVKDRTVVHSVTEAQLAAATAALARVQAPADKIRDMPATGWITDRLDIALKLTPDPDPCERCKGHGVVPDWSNWNEAYGEPRPKPCPVCGNSGRRDVVTDDQTEDAAEVQRYATGGTVRDFPTVEQAGPGYPLPKSPPGPEGLYEAVMAMYGRPLPHPPDLPSRCPCGGGDIGGERIHDPHCPMHPEWIRAIQAHLDAQLPESARAAGIHFEFESTPVTEEESTP